MKTKKIKIKTKPTQSSKKPLISGAFKIYGGEQGIRTLERVSSLHAFQACAFDRSANSPKLN